MKFYTLLLCLLLFTLNSCKKDDESPLYDAEEYFTATVVGSIDGSTNFAATTDDISDHMTARAQGSVEDTRLQLRGKNYRDFLDIQFEIRGYRGSGTYTSGDRSDNSNVMRYGQRRITTWWVSTGGIHEQITPGRLTITDTGEFLEGTFSFQAFRNANLKQVDGRFKVRKEY
jgi:hypothetical protein